MQRLAARDTARSEANVQSDVRSLLLYGGLDLDEGGIETVNLETQVGLRRRIDVEAGCAVIEVKKNLTVANVAEAAVEQLTGYVADRSEETGERFVGILTDGAEWQLYHLLPADERLALVSRLVVNPANPDVDGLIVWLEGILATRAAISPSPWEIELRLGASSSAFALARAELLTLYRSCADRPQVVLKRELYAKLLTTAFGTQFRNEDELFVEHTLLVVMAELIAHIVLGIRVTDHTPTALLSGVAFHDAGIDGVVEADFFDWMLEAEGGEAWVRSLARRVSRFAWKEADHDVLKVLYESIIDTRQRHRLGEYYTPDWLAERIVRVAIPDPLTTRCADVSCGSGTFLFHAIRHYLTTAEQEGSSNREAIHGLVGRVLGIDVHPVAVTLARVTYLLAIGTERLTGDRPPFAVPVYLGDAIQWRHEKSLLSEGQVSVRTSEGGGLLSDDLRFPQHILADTDRFDLLVSVLTTRATTAERPRWEIPPIDGVLDEFKLEGSDRTLVAETFRQLCILHDEGRDHIWGYYVRNLVRPVWLAQPDNKVDVLIGNPPWLAYRYMTPPMQAAFRSLSAERGLWAGAKVATHQDLSALFVVRAAELYLRQGGRLAYVMPEAVLSRLAYDGFRRGDWPGPSAHVRISFDTPWSLGRIKPPVFRVPSCVVFGQSAKHAAPMPTDAMQWRGKRPAPNASWHEAEGALAGSASSITVATDEIASPYHSAFAQGATVVPRVLLVVEDAPAVGVLGTPAGLRRVRSRRVPEEKKPWKSLPSLTHAVESRFLYPLHLGRTILPFRCLEPLTAVIPWDGSRLLSGEDADLARYPGVEGWWREAEALWGAHRSSERLTLVGQIDYQHKLSKQFPLTRTQRVVYPRSGQYLASARIEDPTVLIDFGLYWADCESVDEARFLTAIFNAPITTTLVTPLMSRGEHNPRDFTKYIFQLPIPLYESENSEHRSLVALAERAEAVASTVDVPAGKRFETVRRLVREALAADGVLPAIDEAVTRLLDVAG